MTTDPHPMFQLLREDTRFKFEAYQFVREALGYAQDVLKMGKAETLGEDIDSLFEDVEEEYEVEGEAKPDRHITGQQLCEAIREYAVEQYGFMAKVVLNSWGVHTTGDFGEIVYNLIQIGWMKKSDDDSREDFDGAYDFEEAFCEKFKITLPEGD